MSENSPTRPTSRLDPDGDEIARTGKAALDWMVGHLAGIGERRIMPLATSREIRDRLREPLPREGRSAEEIFATFRDVVVEGNRVNGHPRFFGYVAPPGTAIAAIADLLASALNANLTAWRSAPAPVELERLTIDWIREAMGCDAGTAGLFTSGGSMANFTALAAARHRAGGDALRSGGVRALARPLVLYASEETHHSIDKAAVLLGLGEESVRRIAVDERLRMDVGELERTIAADRARGLEPFCVVANAGTVVTGAVDPLTAIAEVARRERIWFHVDACYGGFARLAPSARALFDGIAEADSIALDPHKWLYLPVDCGCVLYREPESVQGAFALGADYTRVSQSDPDEAFAFWDYGPELSRRFRALKVWMTLAYAGTREIGEAIEGNLDCARYGAALVDTAPDFERMAPVELSILCFRMLPPGSASPRSEAQEEAIDLFNERLLAALQKDGSSYLSNARIGGVRGRFALRACVLNYRTTRRDMEILFDDLRRVAAALEV